VAWNDERISLLKELWTDGRSASEIANLLGNVTRSAVIGKVHRLGLPCRDAKRARIWRRKKEHAPVIRGKKVVWGTGLDPLKKIKAALPKPPVLRTEPVPDPRADDIPTKTLMDLEPGDCRWRVDKPLGSDPYGFCAKETLPGLTFCEGHARRAYANWPEVKHKYVKPVEAREKEAV